MRFSSGPDKELRLRIALAGRIGLDISCVALLGLESPTSFDTDPKRGSEGSAGRDLSGFSVGDPIREADRDGAALAFVEAAELVARLYLMRLTCQHQTRGQH